MTQPGPAGAWSKPSAKEFYASGVISATRGFLAGFPPAAAGALPADAAPAPA